MLHTGVNHFNWQVNNFGDIFLSSTTTSTLLTADGSAHTKGSDTALLAGLEYDCWGITLVFLSGNTDATIRRQLIDLLIDPAAGVGNAGSSWSVAINNIFTGSPAVASGMMGHAFYFPLFLPAGTAIGARTQDIVGGATVRCQIRVVGQPTRPDLVKVGQKVQTIGANTATTSGVAVTVGNGALGSYSASMGTLTNDAWWWQLGIGCGDTSMTGSTFYRFDVAHDATAKYICMQDVPYLVTSNIEQSSKLATGDRAPIRHAPAGTDVYVRGGTPGTPDSNFVTVVYAVT